MKQRATPKNWVDFQHYKDRRPPWVKLHRSLIDDRAFMSLPLASRALAPMLWLIASEEMGGFFDADPEELAFRLRRPIEEIREGLAPLFEAGFFVLEDGSASALLAGCPQLATPETETETETEGESPQAAPSPPRTDRKSAPATLPTASAVKPPEAAPASKKDRELTLAAWLSAEQLAGRKAISDFEGLWRWADAQRIPRDWIEVAWTSFKATYRDDPNRNRRKQIDWRSAFLRHLREGFAPRLWFLDRETGEPRLTDAGRMAIRELEAAEVAA